MAHPKLRNIVRYYRKGLTIKDIAWAVDEEPAVVREALDYHWNKPKRIRACDAKRKAHTEAVETVRTLLAAGYSIEVVRANFSDLVSEEEMAHG
jgi:uncharacterized protein (DUF433 family)